MFSDYMILFTKKYVIWLGASIFLGVGHRITALYAYYIYVFSPIYMPVSNLEGLQALLETRLPHLARGLLGEIVFAFAMAAIILSFPSRLRGIVFSIFAVFLSANIVHIVYNFSHIEFSTVPAALSLSFLSAYAAQAALYLVPLTILGRLGYLLFRARPVYAALLIIPSMILLNLFSIEVEKADASPRWLSMHPVLPDFNSQQDVFLDGRSFPLEIAQVEASKHFGELKYNVLLVFMEGVSALSLDRGEMSFLKDLRADNLSFSRYVGNQIITFNGLYASLTGHLPTFGSSRPKWLDIEAESSVAKNSLAYRFKLQGYHTAFLQSSPLSYMSKDLILPRIGFDVVLGLDAWSNPYSENAWGVDDRTLFKNIDQYLASLPDQQRWFVSALTSGTHSPYNVPQDYKTDETNARWRSLQYLDNSLAEMFERLDNANQLDDTIVILTADESRELSFGGGVLDELALNWLPLVIVHPEGHDLSFDSYVSAHRLPEIVLSLAAGEPPSSLLARMDDGAPILAGNILERRLFYIDTRSETVFACTIVQFLCSVYEEVSDPFLGGGEIADQVAVFPEMLQRIVEMDSKP